MNFLKTKKIFLFCFFCCLPIFSQNIVLVKGFLFNSANQPLEKGTLKFKNKLNSFLILSDSIGTYQALIPKGAYEIEINHEGFLEEKKTGFIAKDTLFNFYLKPNENALNEVVVTKSLKKILSVSNLDKLTFVPNEFKAVSFIMGNTDVLKALQLTPGVQNSGDANGYVYVRGGDPGHNLMLYANAPIYGTAHLLGVFPFYNADHVEEVLFDKSSLSPQYGGRLSATISLKTNSKIPEKLIFSGNLGLLASQLSLAIPLHPKVGVYLSGRKTYIDEISSHFFNSENDNQLKYGFYDFNFKTIAQLAKNQQLSLDAFVSNDKFKTTDKELNLDANLSWSNLALSSTWDYKVSKASSITSNIYFSKYKNNLQLQQETLKIESNSYIQDFGFSSLFRSSYIKKIPFEAGFSLANYKLQPQAIKADDLIFETNENQNSGQSHNSSFFINMTPKMTNHFEAELGMRFNYYNLKKSLYFEPRIGFHYNFMKKKSIFVSYTRQNQFLNLITTSSVGIPTDFWLNSSENIPVQQSDAFAIGGKYSFHSKYSTNGSVFYRKMINLIEYPYSLTQFNEISTFKNDVEVGKGSAYGLEWMFKKEKGKFKGWISYTLSWSDRQFEGINNGVSYFAKYDRRHNLAIIGTYTINERFDFGITQIYSSGNRYTTPTSWYFINNNPVKDYGKYNNAQLPNYIRTDFSMNYYFIKTSQRESALNFSIFNVFNIKNPIYIVQNAIIDRESQKVEITPEQKVIYSILPSISWRFKF